ncbi:MAG: prephenate dehydrogenase dimerization domain-containing protein, partial [Anaerolineaceae bacterium]|nr:prephenate dehydrogenase dimerization domain-containing protein [Anaerolineaceae bacterium]
DPIGGHPMCGRERSTLANADAALYHGAAFALLPLERTTLRARRLTESLVRAAGAIPVWLDPKTHDRLAAATSHAPYLLANILAAVTPSEAALLIGPGFRSSTRLAETPPGVMLDILATNRQNIIEQLQRCRLRLEEIEACLSSGDETGLAQMLGEGRARYLDLMSEAESRGGH